MKGTKRDYLASLESLPGIAYCGYPLEKGVFFLFADDISLKYAYFGCYLRDTRSVEEHFLQGEKEPLRRSVDFLDRYFRHQKAPLPPLDLSPFSEREQAVYQALLTVPPGETISYGALAGRAGIPRGARFIGNAMAKNHFPLFIPCHRVIRSDGALGGYTGGKEIKVFLLEHEKSFTK